MAALVASRHNPILKPLYLRLLDRGKAKKLALTALMRKLIVRANQLLKSAVYSCVVIQLLTPIRPALLAVLATFQVHEGKHRKVSRSKDKATDLIIADIRKEIIQPHSPFAHFLAR